MSARVDLTGLPRITIPVFYPLYANKSRFLLFIGGAGSGKSHFVATKIVVRCMRSEPVYPHHFLAIRKVARTLKGSVFAQLLAAIDQFGDGFRSLWKINRSDYALDYLPTGSRISCVGMDDSEKLKSIVGVTGAWCEEATELLESDLKEVRRRMRHPVPMYPQIILSLNPILISHWIKVSFIDKATAWRKANMTIHRSTFLDNPFLSEDYKKDLHDEWETDPYSWQVYGLGEWGVLGNRIYDPFEIRDRPERAPDDCFYGMDFGFNAPATLMRFDGFGREYYSKEEIYERGLTDEDLIELMGALEISKVIPMYADNEDPAAIEAIRRAGYNIIPADKGPGSVLAGIKTVKRFKIYTTESNVNFNAETAAYHWSEDKQGNKLEVPFKARDHALDAMRYGFHTHLRPRVPEREYVLVEDLESYDDAGMKEIEW